MQLQATYNTTVTTEIDTASDIVTRITSALKYNGPNLDGSEYGTLPRNNPSDDEVMRLLGEAIDSLRAAKNLFGLSTVQLDRDAKYHARLNWLSNNTILR